jgi:hypothetical protein
VSSLPSDLSTYFDRHPVRIASSLNSLGVELWNQEMDILSRPTTERSATERSSTERSSTERPATGAGKAPPEPQEEICDGTDKSHPPTA